MIKTKVFYAVQCDRCGHVEDDHWMPDIESLEYDDWLLVGKKHYCPGCLFINHSDVGGTAIYLSILRITRFLKLFLSCRNEADIVGNSVECFLLRDGLTKAQIKYIEELASPYSIIVHIVPPNRKLVVEVRL